MNVKHNGKNSLRLHRSLEHKRKMGSFYAKDTINILHVDVVLSSKIVRRPEGNQMLSMILADNL